MAEGAEETESNNADTPAMLGAVLPCEALTASIGGMKREFDAIGVQSSPTHISNSNSSITTYSTSASVKQTRTTTPTIITAAQATKSPSPSSSSGNVQQHPINLKSEVSQFPASTQIYEHEINNRTRPPSPHISTTDSEREKCSDYFKSLTNSRDRLSPHENTTSTIIPAQSAQNHMNGTMQDMINLQKLQNLASMQQQQQQQQQQQHQQQQHSSVPGALASLQGLAGISSAAPLNSPLNLSVGSTSTLSSPNAIPPVSSTLGSTGEGISGCSPSGSPQMPQLILASGQLVQGVQGAQLLIPTSQGIAIQTILTIPVSQQINTNEQFMQGYAALNSSASAFNNSSLSSHQIPPMPPQSNFMKPNLFSTGVQQLLAALHPQLFSGHHHRAAAEQLQQSHMQYQSPTQQSLHKLQPPSSSLSPTIETSSQIQSHIQDACQVSQASQSIRNSPLTNLSISQLPKQSPPRSSNFGLHLSSSSSSSQDKPLLVSTPPSTNTYTPSSGSQLFHTHSPNSHMTSSSHSLSSQVNSPSSVCVLNSINRLTSTNGELTITKSHAPPNHSMTASSASPSPGSTNHHTHSMKLSPSSMHLSPTGTEASTTDLLVDSPNEPTINQTNCNVVDGIDLDEIKEFAKAFKLRRLSLGLTQTQVGQALSVTEGPAYSQSAICSALAAQMYAAQLSSQQQNMFEKLDITPKSAQKIKPVLERWMKEAEESHWNRYKTGQNHLTDFIGVEPSKKRKRRTSFTPQALELLNAHFERNTHPSGTEITGLAHQLGYEREVIRIWFCNKRQALKNTVRMMSKGMV